MLSLCFPFVRLFKRLRGAFKVELSYLPMPINIFLNWTVFVLETCGHLNKGGFEFSAAEETLIKLTMSVGILHWLLLQIIPPKTVQVFQTKHT